MSGKIIETRLGERTRAREYGEFKWTSPEENALLFSRAAEIVALPWVRVIVSMGSEDIRGKRIRDVSAEVIDPDKPNDLGPIWEVVGAARYSGEGELTEEQVGAMRTAAEGIRERLGLEPIQPTVPPGNTPSGSSVV